MQMRKKTGAATLVFSVLALLTGCGGGGGGGVGGVGEGNRTESSAGSVGGAGSASTGSTNNTGSVGSAGSAGNDGANSVVSGEQTQGGSAQGSGSGQAAATVQLPGVYQGTATDGFFYRMLVLQDLSHWAVYGLEANENLYLHGMVNGTRGLQNTYQWSSTARFYSISGQAETAQVKATWSAGGGLVGTMETDLKKLSFNTQQLSSPRYVFNTTPSLADAAGTWRAGSLNSQSGSLVVAPDGTLNANLAGCLMRGQLSTASTGHNTFKVQIRYGDAPCSQPQAQYAGDAVTYKTVDGAALMLFASSQGGERAMVMLGKRN